MFLSRAGSKSLLRTRTLQAAAVVLSAFGLWVSLHRTFAQWGVESDTASLVMLWQGWQRHGWAFVTSWYYTPDNWFLSLLPLNFLLFAVAGANPSLVVLTGWAILLACTALTVLIARLIGARDVALWLAPFFLASSSTVLGPTGFLAYPITHNSSAALGLIALYGILRWLVEGRGGWLGTGAAALVIGVTSDPWTLAAFLLPMLLASVVALPASLKAGQASRTIAVVLVLLGSVVLSQTRLFGLLQFLRSDAHTFEVNSWDGMNANFLLMTQVLAAMFNPLLDLQQAWPLVVVAVWCALLGLTATALALLMKRVAFLRPEEVFANATFAFSCGAIVVAFLIGRFPLGAYVGRFFINLYLLLPLMLSGLLTRDTAPRLARAVLVLYAIFMLVTGLATSTREWRRSLRVNTFGASELSAFLEANGLRYGYGGYWGAHANAVSWLSDGRVKIRAVVFDAATGRISPRRMQTSPFWYDELDRPAGALETFLVIRSDGENCQDLTLCRAGAIGQFGTPTREYTFQDAKVLVFPGPILGRLDRL